MAQPPGVILNHPDGRKNPPFAARNHMEVAVNPASKPVGVSICRFSSGGGTSSLLSFPSFRVDFGSVPGFSFLFFSFFYFSFTGLVSVAFLFFLCIRRHSRQCIFPTKFFFCPKSVLFCFVFRFVVVSLSLSLFSLSLPF